MYKPAKYFISGKNRLVVIQGLHGVPAKAIQFCVKFMALTTIYSRYQSVLKNHGGAEWPQSVCSHADRPAVHGNCQTEAHDAEGPGTASGTVSVDSKWHAVRVEFSLMFTIRIHVYKLTV